MDVYGPLFRSVLFPVWETHVRRRPVVDRLQELRRTQWLSLDELHALQARALAELVDHAYRYVPMYRSVLRARGLTPADIQTPADLVKLPVLRRPDLRGHDRSRASTAPPRPSI